MKAPLVELLTKAYPTVLTSSSRRSPPKSERSVYSPRSRGISQRVSSACSPKPKRTVWNGASRTLMRTAATGESPSGSSPTRTPENVPRL